MEKKRGRLEVIYDILNIIKNNKNSIKMTPLLRKSNLSSERFQNYYAELSQKGFVREIISENSKTITLTDKGFKYLDTYKNITSFIDDFDL